MCKPLFLNIMVSEKHRRKLKMAEEADFEAILLMSRLTNYVIKRLRDLENIALENKNNVSLWQKVQSLLLETEVNIYDAEALVKEVKQDGSH